MLDLRSKHLFFSIHKSASSDFFLALGPLGWMSVTGSSHCTESTVVLQKMNSSKS